MFIFFMLMALIFLISGGVGLFYTNVNLAVGSHYWIIGNITFATFAIVGAATLIFMAFNNREFE